MKIISGGQIGVDRAALDFAKEQEMETGGWAPKGWQTANGPDLSLKGFGLKEHTGGYRERTIANIKDSDGTLILAFNMNSPGTKLTLNEANRQLKPCLSIHLADPDPERVAKWIKRNQLEILNVAGNRQAPNVDIYKAAKIFLMVVFTRLTIRKSAILKLKGE